MSRFSLALLLSSILLAVLMQGPQIVHMLDERYVGVPVHLNSDEHNYLPRVQEALEGRGDRTHEPIVGDPEIQGLQTALYERVIGTVFRWTGFSAAEVLQILDSVIPVALYLAIVWFLMLCGFSRWEALAGGLLFVVLELYNLGRPVNQRGTFLVAVLAMGGVVQHLHQHRSRRSISSASRIWIRDCGGLLLPALLLGLLPSISFWAASFAWCFSVLYVLSKLLNLSKKEDRIQLLKSYGLVFGIALLIAIPFILGTLESMRHPLYMEVQYRSGIYHARSPQSLTWSILFLAMSLGVLWKLLSDRVDMQQSHGVLALIFTAFIVINQQVVHGTVMFFNSHYLFGLVLAAIACLVFCFKPQRRSGTVVVSGICALVFLGGIAYDSRSVIAQWTPVAERYSEQHLASTLDVLRKLPRQRILSDPASMNFIASHTHHDVPYWLYLKNTLISDQEYAERYCLPLVGLSKGERDQIIAEERWLLYFEVKDLTEGLRNREVEIVTAACDSLAKDIGEALEQYEIDLLFWDEVQYPDRDPANLGISLEKLAIGQGWSLWRKN